MNKGDQCAECGGDLLYFPSKKEARRWSELVVLQDAGKICGLMRQVEFELKSAAGEIQTPKGRVMKHIVDFCYYDEKRQQWIYEDAKGMDTEIGWLKRQLVKLFYGYDIEIY